MNTRVVVIGAGASGLFAAGFLAQRGASVLVLEKTQRTAGKVRISGKGRCNLTNAVSVRDFPQNYKTNGRFLYSALHRFSNKDCIRFFENRGLRLKIERGQRVFPCSNDANQIADALENFARENGARILFGEKVFKIQIGAKNRIEGVFSFNGAGSNFFPAESVIVATGGMSYPGTGSSGDGYKLARDLGHKIIEPRPALVPLRTEEKWVRELAGLSLKNVELKLTDHRNQNMVLFGELMFTHFGLTGPIVLTASEQVGLWLRETKMPVSAAIDLKPALNEQQLDQRVLRDLQKYSRKHFLNSLGDLLPRKLIPVIISLSTIPGDKPCHQITKKERSLLVRLLKRLPLTIIDTLPLASAIVTAGGVELSEIDPRRMESKLKRGLFFVGEVLDIHGVTGGFNLQAAFSTGYCAAHSVELETEG
ncbi:MAG: NAD(P)/FAD-dependent oxidoreductase [Firmicutes bacterium]|nr:NAD(P)/FAD-dependent oxidoreductase [Bacillota bacterium]